MRVIVTGASGFLGTELLDQLIGSDRYEICAATSRPGDLQARINSQAAAIVDSKALLEDGFFKHGDIIINCAFPRGRDGFDLARGLDYLSQLVANASQSRIAGLVNISSQSVYDQHRDRPAREVDPLCLQSSYAVAKRAVELLVEANCQDTPFSNIRLASLVGPEFNQRMPNRMVEIAFKTGKIEVSENDSRFGFMDVRDAADALLRMLAAPAGDWRNLYNLSSEQTWTLFGTAQTIRAIFEDDLGLDVKVEKTPSKSDPSNTLVDSTAFWTAFDWHPSYDEYDSLRAIIDSMRP